MSTVTDHLETRGAPYEVIDHERAYTSIEEARALGISADEILKTVVLDTASGQAVLVLPASRRLDMKLVHQAVEDNKARLATEEEIQRDFPDYELGAVPPFRSLLGVPVYVDPEVMQHDTVVFAAGTETQSVRMRTEDLFRDEPVILMPLTRHSYEGEEA